jgi:hypothetical protein
MILVSYEKLAYIGCEHSRVVLAYKGRKSEITTEESVKVKFGPDKLILVNPDGTFEPLKSSLRKFSAQELMDEVRPLLQDLYSSYTEHKSLSN